MAVLAFILFLTLFGKNTKFISLHVQGLAYIPDSNAANTAFATGRSESMRDISRSEERQSSLPGQEPPVTDRNCLPLSRQSEVEVG
jgi:hypothetical protein